jgi:hypothetical protein
MSRDGITADGYSASISIPVSLPLANLPRGARRRIRSGQVSENSISAARHRADVRLAGRRIGPNPYKIDSLRAGSRILRKFSIALRIRP